MSHGPYGGTAAGYRRHYRAMEEPCLACLEAHRAYNRKHEQKLVADYQTMSEQSLDEGLIDQDDADILLRRQPW